MRLEISGRLDSDRRDAYVVLNLSTKVSNNFYLRGDSKLRLPELLHVVSAFLEQALLVKNVRDFADYILHRSKVLGIRQCNNVSSQFSFKGACTSRFSSQMNVT